jgi:hypothetical protein
MRSLVLGMFLAVWSFAFACVHVAWAFGWRGWLPADLPSMSDRPWFLAYDVVAGGLMYAAAAVALYLSRSGPSAPLARDLRLATLVGSVAALGRGVPALAWDLDTGHLSGVAFAADVWFTVAGAAGLLLWRATRPGARGRTPASGRLRPAAGAR